MGNQLDPHVLRDAKKITATLEQGNFKEASNLLYQVAYFYPYQIADLLTYVFHRMPKDDQAESIVQVGIQRFVQIHKSYGETDIGWWYDTYQYILGGVCDHDFNLIAYYAQIYELLLTCAYFEEPSRATSIIKDAIRYLGGEHPLVAQLNQWVVDTPPT